jgi:RimJ/RimL family protein N-acetyltransferase
VRLVLTGDQHEFAAHAAGLLEARVEYNVMATVLAGVLAGDYANSTRLFAYALDDVGELEFAALRQPPWPMLVTELPPAASRELVAAWLNADPDLPGVNGPPEAARAIAAAWRELTGGVSRCRMREAMHSLDHVRDPPWPATGGLRLASTEERDVLIEWMAAFAREAGVPGEDQAAGLVDLRLGQERLFVWDDGVPVSMVGTAPVVADVARVGPVYTPPENRGRGYAGSAVAAVSRRALARGARRCVLFTDLANPTSNKIYAEVGYRRVTDWEEHAFERV